MQPGINTSGFNSTTKFKFFKDYSVFFSLLKIVRQHKYFLRIETFVKYKIINKYFYPRLRKLDNSHIY